MPTEIERLYFFTYLKQNNLFEIDLTFEKKNMQNILRNTQGPWIVICLFLR